MIVYRFFTLFSKLLNNSSDQLDQLEKEVGFGAKRRFDLSARSFELSEKLKKDPDVVKLIPEIKKFFSDYREYYQTIVPEKDRAKRLGNAKSLYEGLIRAREERISTFSR